MTRMIESLAARPALQRIAIAFALATIGLFLVGMALGVVAAIVTKGWPSRLWVSFIPLVAAPLGIAAIVIAWRLVAPPKSASTYEKKYWNVWLAIVAISAPVGAISAILFLGSGMPPGKVFTSAPIAPGIAIALALLVTAVCVGAVALYHRAIDDHEERAYLWGSQLAYYFLIIAFPAWWLLERGGIVGAITTGTAFAAVLLSFIVQAGVWAWLKYR
jgi:MFS family permease